jgi:hypothetical protein
MLYQIGGVNAKTTPLSGSSDSSNIYSNSHGKAVMRET